MSNTQTALKSNQGQQAAPIRLTFEELTDNEQQLVVFLGTEGRPVYTITEIMEGLNWHLGRTGRARGNSRVRNTLRRLVRSKWVAHSDEIGDGKYRISVGGFNRLTKVAETIDQPAAAPSKAKPAKKAETLTSVPPVLVTPAPVSSETEQDF